MFWLFLLLKLILYLFAGFILLIILFLILPFSYESNVVLLDGVRANFRIGWPWRFMNITGSYDEETLNMSLYIINKRVCRLKNKVNQESEEENKKPKKEKEKKENKDIMQSIKNLADKKFTNEIITYLKSLYDIAKPQYLQFSGVYGFDDPSLTGMAAGAIAALNNAMPKARISLYPNFTDEIIELELKTAGSLLVGPAVYLTVRTMLKRTVRDKLFKRRKK